VQIYFDVSVRRNSAPMSASAREQTNFIATVTMASVFVDTAAALTFIKLLVFHNLPCVDSRFLAS
jgi:hypothetical protein